MSETPNGHKPNDAVNKPKRERNLGEKIVAKVRVPLAAVALSAGVLGIPYNNVNHSPVEVTVVKAEDTKSDFEAKYGVKTASMLDAYQAGVQLIYYDGHVPSSDVFTTREIKDLDEDLSLLPEHFYRRANGQLLLIKGPDFASNTVPVPHVYVGPTEKRRYNFAKTTHEIVHTLHNDLLGGDSHATAEPKLISAMGSDYPTFQKVVENAVRPKIAGLLNLDEEYIKKSTLEGGITFISQDEIAYRSRSLSPEDKIKLSKYIQLEYSVSRQSTFEFVPVMAEVYLKGKDFFTQTFSEFLPESTAASLYTYTKDEIFRGTEYSHFPVRQNPDDSSEDSIPYFTGTEE